MSRKLAAIMFTDMVGYGILIEKNTHRALELLDEHRRIVRSIFPKHGGLEIDTAGDSFLIIFESALNATLCAIEIQSTLNARNNETSPERTILIRIGLDLGDVEYTEEHIGGEGVNIAKRIESLAKPGGIAISEAVQREVRYKIDLKIVKLGPWELKHVELRMNVYRIALNEEDERLNWREWFSYMKKLRSVQLGAALVLVLSATIAIRYVINIDRVSEGPTSLAVLPFKNIGGSSQDEYLADGISEDIANQLSNSQIADVISSRSAFYYKNSPLADSSIARQLGVRFLLHGGMNPFPQKVRVDVSLYDSTEKKSVRQDTYDVSRQEIIAARDTVVARVVHLLSLDGDVIRRSSYRPAPQAYLSYLRGLRYRDQMTKKADELAISYFADAVREDPTFVKALVALADAQVEDGRFAEAQSLSKQALGIEGTNVAAQGVLGYTQYELEQASDSAREAGLNLLKKSVDVNRNSITGLTRLGAINLFDRNDAKAALIYFQKAHDLEPWYSIVNSNLGIAFGQLKKYDEATAMFHRAIVLDSTNFRAWAGLGYICERLKQYDSAAYNYTQSLNQQPGEFLAYHGLTEVSLLTHRYAEAASILIGGLKHLPDEVGMHYDLGLCYSFLGRQDDAKAAFSEGLQTVRARLRMDTTYYAEGFAYMALLNARLELRSDAEWAATQAAKYDSTGEEAVIKLARIYAVLGKRDELLKWFQRARNKTPEYDEAYLNSAIDLERYRDDPELVQIAKQ